MADREKVIDHLLIIRTWNEVGKAYAYDEMDKKEKAKTVEWVDDALAMLKEQEPLAVPEGKVNKCVCGNEINRYWHPEYCGFCGKKLEWY